MEEMKTPIQRLTEFQAALRMKFLIVCIRLTILPNNAVPLQDFRGNWVEVTEIVNYSTHGTYFVKINRISDQKLLITVR